MIRLMALLLVLTASLYQLDGSQNDDGKYTRKFKLDLVGVDDPTDTLSLTIVQHSGPADFDGCVPATTWFGEDEGGNSSCLEDTPVGWSFLVDDQFLGWLGTGTMYSKSSTAMFRFIHGPIYVGFWEEIIED